jgi:hypothetical protein
MSKILEDFNFKNHGKYEIDGIISGVLNFTDEWFINTSRQEKYSVHKHTNSYFIYQTDLNWKSAEFFLVEPKTINKNILDLVEPIIKSLENLYDGVRGNVLFIKLLAGTKILPHHDDGEYLECTRRNHIPIITSDKTSFSVGSEKINMGLGECWEINNTRLHSVENNSNIDRVHLVIDIMPNKYIRMENN